HSYLKVIKNFSNTSSSLIQVVSGCKQSCKQKMENKISLAILPVYDNAEKRRKKFYQAFGFFPPEVRERIIYIKNKNFILQELVNFLLKNRYLNIGKIEILAPYYLDSRFLGKVKDLLFLAKRIIKRRKVKIDLILVITTADIYERISENVPQLIGGAFVEENIAVLSICHLEADSIFSLSESINRNALHEIGHLLGLKHCQNRCVMSKLLNVFGYMEFCPSCQRKLNKRCASPLAGEKAVEQIKELDIDKMFSSSSISSKLTNRITSPFTFPHRLDGVYRYLERFALAFFGLDLSKGKKLIVDVGMGGRGAPTTFDMYRILSKLNPELKIIGIDYNPENVKLAQEEAQKRKIRNISFIKAGFNFNVQKNPDIITCFNVLMDYKRDERLAAIKKLRRRLKNKGVLLEGRSDDIGKYISFIIYQLENEVLIRKQIIFCVNLKSLTNPQLFRRVLPAEFIGDELDWGISSFIEEWEYSNYRFMYLNNPKQILKSVAEELRKKNYNVIPDSKLLKREYVVLKYKRNGKASSTLRQQKREILPQSVIDKLIQVYFKQRSPQNKKCVDGFCCFIKNEKSFPVKLVSFFSADLDEVLNENLISSAKQDYPCDKLGIFFDYKDNKLYILTKCTDYQKRPTRCREHPENGIFSYERCEYQSFLERRREYLYILFEDALRNNPIVNASEEIKEGGIYFTKEAFRFLKEVFKEESINAGGVNFSSFVILLPERRKEVSFYGGINRKNTLKNTIRGSSSPVYFGRKPLKDEDIPSLLSRCFERVEEERNKAGINISELCRKSGVKLSTYEFIRLGRRRPGNPVFILNLLKYFGLEERLSPQERELLNEALRMGTKGVRKLLRDKDRIIPKRIWKEVTRRLEDVIRRKKLKEVSKKLNIPYHTLRSWKKGESQPLHPIYIKKILQYFNLLNELSQEERQRLNRKIREIDKISYYQQGKNSLRKIAKEIGSSHQTVKDIIVRIKERERKILKGVELGILTVEVKREGEVSRVTLVKRLSIRSITEEEAYVLTLFFNNIRPYRAIIKAIEYRKKYPQIPITEKILLSWKGIGKKTIEQIKKYVDLEENNNSFIQTSSSSVSSDTVYLFARFKSEDRISSSSFGNKKSVSSSLSETEYKDTFRKALRGNSLAKSRGSFSILKRKIERIFRKKVKIYSFSFSKIFKEIKNNFTFTLSIAIFSILLDQISKLVAFRVFPQDICLTVSSQHSFFKIIKAGGITFLLLMCNYIFNKVSLSRARKLFSIGIGFIICGIFQVVESIFRPIVDFIPIGSYVYSLADLFRDGGILLISIALIIAIKNRNNLIKSKRNLISSGKNHSCSSSFNLLPHQNRNTSSPFTEQESPFVIVKENKLNIA
ncbi:MAG: hypothetical protein DRP76_02905, partial [Candidatus Omnitrophota bacterium]